MLSALDLLDRIAEAPEPERGVCRKCGASSAPGLLWLCAGCADALHAGRAESEARMLARVMEIGERFRFPYDLYLDAGRASWERKARTFPERALQAAEAYAAKLERDDRKELPF